MGVNQSLCGDVRYRAMRRKPSKHDRVDMQLSEGELDEDGGEGVKTPSPLAVAFETGEKRGVNGILLQERRRTYEPMLSTSPPNGLSSRFEPAARRSRPPRETPFGRADLAPGLIRGRAVNQRGRSREKSSHGSLHMIKRSSA